MTSRHIPSPWERTGTEIKKTRHEGLDTEPKTCLTLQHSPEINTVQWAFKFVCPSSLFLLLEFSIPEFLL